MPSYTFVLHVNISHLIFVSMIINNIFRNWGKNAESIRRCTRKNTHIMVTDRPREVKLVPNHCRDIFLYLYNLLFALSDIFVV